MQTYNDLTDTQKEKALEKATNILLGAILEGAIRFNDDLNSDTLQSQIDQAITEADSMQTPWFASEYIMDAAGDEIKAMAICDAEDALYPESGEFIINLQVA